MKGLWDFIAPVNLGGSNRSRLSPTWGVLLARSPWGADTHPPRGKIWGGGRGGHKCEEETPRGLVSVGWRGCGEIPHGSAGSWPGGASHAPSCIPPPRRAGHPSPKRLWKVPERFPPPATAMPALSIPP